MMLLGHQIYYGRDITSTSWLCCDKTNLKIKVITKLPNSEQSYKGKVKSHNYPNMVLLWQLFYLFCSCIWILLQWQPEPLNRNESGRFGALKSDSTHHFFRNACTKSLRFSQFSGCWLILKILDIFDFFIFIHFHYKMHRLYFFLQRRNIFRQDIGIGI
jgi:hypothetical protein